MRRQPVSPTLKERTLLDGRMPVAAVFEGDYATSRAVQAILEERGFDVVSFAERPADLVSTLTSLSAEVVVLELALAGVSGLNVVRDVIEALPACVVILLSHFEALREPAIAAGASALVGPDLAGLGASLDVRDRSRSTSEAVGLRPRP